jgi:hypothetical protein
MRHCYAEINHNCACLRNESANTTGGPWRKMFKNSVSLRKHCVNTTKLRSETRERNRIWPSCALRNVYEMITHVYACLRMITHVTHENTWLCPRQNHVSTRYACLRMFTHLYACLRMFTHLYACLRMFTNVYACLRMFTHVYACLRMFTHVYACLRMFTHIYAFKHTFLYLVNYWALLHKSYM